MLIGSIPCAGCRDVLHMRIARRDLGDLGAVARGDIDPAVTTVSPACRPWSIRARPSSVSPTVTGRCCTVSSGCTTIDQRAILALLQRVSGTLIAVVLDRRRSAAQ